MERTVDRFAVQPDQGVEGDIRGDVAQLLQVGVTGVAISRLELQSIGMSRPDRNALVAAVTGTVEDVLVVATVNVASSEPAEDP